MLATRWIVERWNAVERWRAMRKNPTFVIGQKKGEAAMRGPLLYAPIKFRAHVIQEPGLTHCTIL